MRRKSGADLQKLWVTLMKERNMLHSTRMLHQKRKTKMPHRDRIQKVRKSMAMIKVVLGERARALEGVRAEIRAAEDAADADAARAEDDEGRRGEPLGDAYGR